MKRIYFYVVVLCQGLLPQRSARMAMAGISSITVLFSSVLYKRDAGLSLLSREVLPDVMNSDRSTMVSIICMLLLTAFYGANLVGPLVNVNSERPSHEKKRPLQAVIRKTKNCDYPPWALRGTIRFRDISENAEYVMTFHRGNFIGTGSVGTNRFVLQGTLDDDTVAWTEISTNGLGRAEFTGKLIGRSLVVSGMQGQRALSPA